MSEYALIPMENLQKMIFNIRGVQVMLDNGGPGQPLRETELVPWY